MKVFSLTFLDYDMKLTSRDATHPVTPVNSCTSCKSCKTSCNSCIFCNTGGNLDGTLNFFYDFLIFFLPILNISKSYWSLLHMDKFILIYVLCEIYIFWDFLLFIISLDLEKNLMKKKIIILIYLPRLFSHISN